MDHDSLLSKSHVNSQQEIAEESDPTLRPRRTQTLISLPIEEIDSPYKDHILSLPEEKRWPPFHLRNYQGFWQAEGILPGIMAFQKHFKPRSDDIFVASSPKCGTTWLIALTFSVINRNKYEFASHPLLRLNPHDCVKSIDMIFCDEGLVYLESLPSPRVLHFHMAYNMLPDSIRSADCKILYICRDPKDALVSLWHMSRALQSDDESIPFSEAFELFCDGRSLAGPIWECILEYWYERLRRPDKILFLRYEEMLFDPLVSVFQIAEFVGQPFTEDEEREGLGEKIVELCSFSKLSGLDVNKKREGGEQVGTNHKFFRKGLAGDWKNHLTAEMAERLDAITRLKLEGSGLIL
jgi:hydroxyjasmonate sulfotransferase